MSSSGLSSLRERIDSRVLRPVAGFVRRRRSLTLLLLVGPAVAILLFFFLVPLLIMAWISFLEGLPPAPTTIENYLKAIEPVYTEIFWFTVVLAVQTTVIAIVLGYAIAYSLFRFTTKTALFLLLIIMPFWTNYIVRIYAWINILQTGGLVDSVLLQLGLAQSAQGYMFSRTAVLIALVYIWLPLATLPLYASLSNVDLEQIEAAKDLGAGPIKTFLTITLPQTVWGITSGVIIVGIPALGTFVVPRLLGGSNAITIGMIIDNQFTSSFNWPFGSALSMLLSLVVIVLLIVGTISGGQVLRRGRL